MKRLLVLVLLIFYSTIYSQGAAYVVNAVNTPTSVANPNVLLGALPIPNGTIKPYIKDDIRWETYNINNFSTGVISITSILYKPLNYTPSYSEVITALGGIPLFSYTETDPIWTGVASQYKTKIQNDLLYEPVFTKNTAFNKNFGNTANTVTEGNDSRVNNGQTAFGWGNHAIFGYVTANSTNTFTNKSGNISQWTNDSGYLTSFTETDPTVPAYSKTLTAFSVIKSSTDSLYKAIGYTPSSLEITTALGYTPVTNARTITINGTTFDLTANRVWTVGDVTTATLTSSLATKENTITAGTTSQYWRGDKSWQTLDKTAVGLGNVDNTSDLSKPISTATQTSLNTKQATLVSGTNIKTVGGNSLLGSGDIAIGTVTSVGITGSDFNITGSPVTSSGNIVLALSTTGVSAGTYGKVTVDTKGRVTAGKRQETYSGVTDASGNYTVTFGTAYGATPNIQVCLISPNVRDTPIPTVSTTGFTVNVQRRTDVVGLLPTYSNVVGGAVHVLITEN